MSGIPSFTPLILVIAVIPSCYFVTCHARRFPHIDTLEKYKYFLIRDGFVIYYRYMQALDKQNDLQFQYTSRTQFLAIQLVWYLWPHHGPIVVLQRQYLCLSHYAYRHFLRFSQFSFVIQFYLMKPIFFPQFPMLVYRDPFAMPTPGRSGETLSEFDCTGQPYRTSYFLHHD